MIGLNVCIGSSCHLRGSYNVINIFQQLIEEHALHDKIDLRASFCMKHCQEGVSVAIDGVHYSVSSESARDFFETVIMNNQK